MVGVIAQNRILSEVAIYRQLRGKKLVLEQSPPLLLLYPRQTLSIDFVLDGAHCRCAGEVYRAVLFLPRNVDTVVCANL